MKIAVNQPRASYYGGGAEVISFAHTKAFLEHGNKVTFCTINPWSVGQEISPRLNELVDYAEHEDNLSVVTLDQDTRAQKIYDIEPGEDKTRWYVESMYYNRVLQDFLLTHGEQFDLLLSYYQFDALSIPTRIIGNNALYLCGIPSTDNDLRQSQLMMYDSLAAISNETAQYWQKYTDKNIPVVLTGVDIPEIKRQPSSFDIDDTIHILFAGRLIERKGVSQLLDAIERLPEDVRSKVYLDIVGEGPQYNILVEQLERLAICDKVVFHGYRNDISNFYMKADICVFPSLRGEGLMGVVLEAMAAAKPVVSTTRNGNDTLLGEDRGRLVAPGDISELSSAIEGLCRQRTLRMEMGRRARRYVMDNHSWRTSSSHLIEALSSFSGLMRK